MTTTLLPNACLVDGRQYPSIRIKVSIYNDRSGKRLYRSPLSGNPHLPSQIAIRRKALDRSTQPFRIAKRQ